MYQNIISKTFLEYLDVFMLLFLDDFTLFSDMDIHFPKLRKCFEKCMEFGIIFIQINVYFWYILTSSLVSLYPKKINYQIQRILRPNDIKMPPIINSWPSSIIVLWKKLSSLWHQSQIYMKVWTFFMNSKVPWGTRDHKMKICGGSNFDCFPLGQGICYS